MSLFGSSLLRHDQESGRLFDVLYIYIFGLRDVGLLNNTSIKKIFILKKKMTYIYVYAKHINQSKRS